MDYLGSEALHCYLSFNRYKTETELIQLDNSALNLDFQTKTSVAQENTAVTSVVQCAITLKDPSDVLAGKVILKMDIIHAQVTLQIP